MRKKAHMKRFTWATIRARSRPVRLNALRGHGAANSLLADGPSTGQGGAAAAAAAAAAGATNAARA